jgi:hypothetical protein
MTEKKTRSRKPRAKKAPVKVVADSPALDEEKMLDEGFEKTRARTAKGHFVKDDPSTPENEAFVWQKPVEEAPKVVVEEVKPEPVVVVEEVKTEPKPEPVVVVEEVKPDPKAVVKKPNPSPVISYGGETKVEEIGCRFKRKRAIRRMGR